MYVVDVYKVNVIIRVEEEGDCNGQVYTTA
jgi:hypothetical protein